MHLTPEQVAAAKACGCSFPLATPDDMQRLTMQRRVFHIDGRPVLAARGGGFYETAGTLALLIAEGLVLQRVRDRRTGHRGGEGGARRCLVRGSGAHAAGSGTRPGTAGRVRAGGTSRDRRGSARTACSQDTRADAPAAPGTRPVQEAAAAALVDRRGRAAGQRGGPLVDPPALAVDTRQTGPAVPMLLAGGSNG